MNSDQIIVFIVGAIMFSIAFGFYMGAIPYAFMSLGVLWMGVSILSALFTIVSKMVK